MKSAMWSVLCRTFYLQLDQEIILYQERIRTKEKAAETELLDLSGSSYVYHNEG